VTSCLVWGPTSGLTLVALLGRPIDSLPFGLDLVPRSATRSGKRRLLSVARPCPTRAAMHLARIGDSCAVDYQPRGSVYTAKECGRAYFALDRAAPVSLYDRVGCRRGRGLDRLLSAPSPGREAASDNALLRQVPRGPRAMLPTLTRR